MLNSVLNFARAALGGKTPGAASNRRGLSGLVMGRR
jgi:hypothetical protein